MLYKLKHIMVEEDNELVFDLPDGSIVVRYEHTSAERGIAGSEYEGWSRPEQWWIVYLEPIGKG